MCAGLPGRLRDPGMSAGEGDGAGAFEPCFSYSKGSVRGAKAEEGR